MAFKLIYHTQNDSKWGSDPLGFGKTTLLQEGCAVSSVAMLLSGYGFNETPGSLNQKLKASQGFSGSNIFWQKISQLYPQVKYVNVVRCEGTDAPLGDINGYLDKGMPVVVGVDTSPVEGFQSHYVLVYAREGNNDYRMLDPWPYRTEQTLMGRYSKDRPLQKVIQRVVFYQGPGAAGPITPSTPASGTASGSSMGTVPIAPARKGKMFVQVTTNDSPVYVNPGRGKVISTEKTGAQLIVIEDLKKAATKIGVAGNWLNVKASNGKSGFIDAGSVKLV